MEQKNVMFLVTAFVALIVGIGLLSVIASEVNSATSFNYAGNETVTITACRTSNADPTLNVTAASNCNFTVTNAPTSWELNGGCPLSGFSMTNHTADTLTANTDYIVNLNTGIVQIINTTEVDGSIDGPHENYTLVSYNHCPDDYLTQGWSRSVINLVGGFFAVALMLVAVALFYAVLKNEGLINI